MVARLGTLCGASTVLVLGALGVRPERDVPVGVAPRSASTLQVKLLEHRSGQYHLAKQGQSTCDFGVPVESAYCLQAGQTILEEKKVVPYRNYLIQPPANGTEEAGGSSSSSSIQRSQGVDVGQDVQIPVYASQLQIGEDVGYALVNASAHAGFAPWCSIKTAGDWAVAFNLDQHAVNGGAYSMVCGEPETAVHLTPQGEKACDHGHQIDFDNCLERGKSLLKGANGNTKLHTIQSPDVPAGCSIHTGGSNNIYFNFEDTGQKEDDSYSLVCSGYPVFAG